MTTRWLACLLEKYGALYSDVFDAVDRYTRRRCISVAAASLANVGTTLAGGEMVAVAPGEMAITKFSTALDKNGNSAHGLLAIQDIAKALKLHVLRSR